MKKKTLKIILMILVILAVWVIINIFDSAKPTSLYSQQDLPPLNLDRNNGYYRIWSLTEPVDVDIESDAVIRHFRNCFDPQTDYNKYIHEHDMANHKNKGTFFMNIYKKSGLKNVNFNSPDWGNQILSLKADIERMDNKMEVFLQRHQKLIHSEIISDFYNSDPTCPIPNLLVWLNVSKVFFAKKILEAKGGNWQQSVVELLDHLDFCKRAVKGFGIMINNLIIKAIMRYNIQALAFVMNQKECPRSVFQYVADHLAPLSYEEFGSRNGFIGEILFSASWLDYILFEEKNSFRRLFFRLFLPTNRMSQRNMDYLASLMEYEKTPPYKWSGDLPRLPLADFSVNPLLFLKKLAYDIYYRKYEMSGKYSSGFPTVVEKSYLTKTLYDMLKISAELHLNYLVDKPIGEILSGLPSYRELLDPCSGKPYLWNEDKQVLYSIGPDREDDHGEFENARLNELDFILPVILYIQD